MNTTWLDPKHVAALPPVVIVTGTDTDVGKTWATAALAVTLAGLGRAVAVDKPVQTGVGPDEPGDAATVRRLVDQLGTSPGTVTTGEGQRLTKPMAPRPAAAIDDLALLPLEAHVERISALATRHDHVLVEGSGGLLVELDNTRRTLADLALLLRDHVDAHSGLVVVVRPHLGTLNHTHLTLEALTTRRLRTLGTIIGTWPAAPTPIEHGNRNHLAGLDVPLMGVLPDGLKVPKTDTSG